MDQIKLFSDFFKEKKEHESAFFYNQSVVGAYLVGAFASAIVESSFDGVFKKSDDGSLVQISHVKENETFKKWLSNQQLTYQSLVRIANKAAYFQRRFNLNSLFNSDLSGLVTDNLKPLQKEKISNQEVSFAFLRGYNDFRTFKYTKKGDN